MQRHQTGNSPNNRWSMFLVRLGMLVLSALLLPSPIAKQVDAQTASSVVDAANGDESRGDQQACLEIDDYEKLIAYAQQQLEHEYVPPPELPAIWADLSYEDFCEITFDYHQAIWSKQNGAANATSDSTAPFWLESFHRGFVQRNQVELYTIEEQGVQELPFDPQNFNYGKLAERITPDPSLGHAGFKIAGIFPGPSDAQEMISFLGGCYFRARTIDTFYGASARGLALDIAMNKPEEFPAFTKFWIRKPEPESPHIVVLAYLDGPRVSGAYELIFEPEKLASVIDIRATVFFRKPVEKIGVAPITSMWMWGDGLAGPPKDKRPGVHDSDGLLIHGVSSSTLDPSPDPAEPKWYWRPFARQAYPSVSFQRMQQVVGFGAMQRNRAFFHYDDHNARYDKRPSVWIQPAEPWSQGRVELLELPGAHEGIDNIGIYWVPDTTPAAGEALTLNYSVSFSAWEPADHKHLGRMTNMQLQRSKKSKSVAMELRFSGPVLQDVGPEKIVQVAAFVRGGKLITSGVTRTETNDWIAKVKFEISGDAPAELELKLLDNSGDLTETVTYLCPPQEPEFQYPSVYTRE